MPSPRSYQAPIIMPGGVVGCVLYVASLGSGGVSELFSHSRSSLYGLVEEQDHGLRTN